MSAYVDTDRSARETLIKSLSDFMWIFIHSFVIIFLK